MSDQQTWRRDVARNVRAPRRAAELLIKEPKARYHSVKERNLWSKRRMTRHSWKTKSSATQVPDMQEMSLTAAAEQHRGGAEARERAAKVARTVI